MSCIEFPSNKVCLEFEFLSCVRELYLSVIKTSLHLDV